MPYVKKDKREQLKERFMLEYKARLEAANGAHITDFSLGDAALDTMIDFMLEGPKEATRSKTFRQPADLMDWLEHEATCNGRSPNAQLTEVLRNAQAAQA